jgi:hypothetical protein
MLGARQPSGHVVAENRPEIVEVIKVSADAAADNQIGCRLRANWPARQYMSQCE